MRLAILVRSDSYDEEAVPVQDPATQHAMKLEEQNRLDAWPSPFTGPTVHLIVDKYDLQSDR